jgi:hypothetical protein
VIINEKLGEGQQGRNGPTPVVLAAAREMDTAKFTHSDGRSVNSACPGKRSDKGRNKGREHSRTSASSHFPNPIPVSNRELSLLERELSYCKQRKATLSNRELWTIRSSAAPSSLMPDRTMVSSRGAPRFADRGSRPLTLPNLNRQIHEFRNAVTYRKQTAAHLSNSQKNQKWMYTFSPLFPPARISPRTNVPTKNEL